MSNDYDRIRAGIEFMTAYTSGSELMTAYVGQRRREDPQAAEHLMDGAAALCSFLLTLRASEKGISKHEVLQEVARAAHRHEQQPEG
ncbi:terminase small subunit [Streptomyces fulvoviolaceus]|uniref:terminase small subunit n=1 Tax=Streptomyces fulvoviolaceus TaxID=285535 RepID=UPI0021BE3DEE|nr:terminase small subunit [Streptomyces fulvoviolaceus]MCT9078793.1 terminase small subunit [Streptomyces fulvoviolaceus]